MKRLVCAVIAAALLATVPAAVFARERSQRRPALRAGEHGIGHRGRLSFFVAPRRPHPFVRLHRPHPGWPDRRWFGPKPPWARRRFDYDQPAFPGPVRRWVPGRSTPQGYLPGYWEYGPPGPASPP